MATRALICYLDEDRELTCTYNHYDGYPDHLGKILDEHFDGDMYAEKIANEGYISYIDENGNIEAKNKRAPEKVKLNENWEDALDEIADIIASYDAEYAYIWWAGDGVWVEIKNTGQRSMVDQLANRMVSAKNIFNKIDENMEPEDEEYDKYADDPNLEVQMDQDLIIDPRLDPYEDREEIEKSIIRLVRAKKSVPESVAKSFVDTHYEDVIDMGNDDEILDEFDEFFIINYLEEEDNIEIDTSDATAGDDAIERESASGAFEEAYNARGETLKEHFKRLTR